MIMWEIVCFFIGHKLKWYSFPEREVAFWECERCGRNFDWYF